MYENIIARIKIVFDCVVYNLHNDINESKLNSDYFHKDPIGYEVSCNEFRSVDYFEYDSKYLGFVVIDTLWHLKNKLKIKYRNRKFCFIISIHDKIDNVRFHTYSDDKKIWISDNLEMFG